MTISKWQANVMWSSMLASTMNFHAVFFCWKEKFTLGPNKTHRKWTNDIHTQRTAHTHHAPKATSPDAFGHLIYFFIFFALGIHYFFSYLFFNANCILLLIASCTKKMHLQLRAEKKKQSLCTHLRNSNSAKYKHIYLNYRAQKFPLKMLLLKIKMIGGG